jgi:hypothetical protein
MSFTKQILSIGGGIGVGAMAVWGAGLCKQEPKPPHRIAVQVNDRSARSDPAARAEAARATKSPDSSLIASPSNTAPHAIGDEAERPAVVTTRLEPPPARDPAAARFAARREEAEQHLAALRAQDEALLERLTTEPFDSKWAPDAIERIRGGLKQLMTGRHFSADVPKCQSTACAVTVHWTDGAAALNEVSSVVEYGFGLDDCTRGLTFPKSNFAPGEPVSAPLVFDCSRRSKPPAPPAPRSG